MDFGARHMPDRVRTILIVPDDELRHRLESLLDECQVAVPKSLAVYPEVDELLRAIRIHKPGFLLVAVDDLEAGTALLAALDDRMPGMPVVGVAHRADEELTRHLMHLGIREYLVSPITRQKVMEMLVFLDSQSAKRPPEPALADLYTFFPAKPGVGTTTIALSTSCALADEFSIPTLLIDGDLAAGIVNFHLNLRDSASIIDALNHAPHLDEDLWRQMVGRRDKLDVLHSGDHGVPAPLDTASLQQVLAMARAQYDVVCADLGSGLDPLSIELLRESRRIFLVTTPEIVPVHMAKRRIRSFTDLGVADRVSLVLNRRDRGHSHLSTSAVAQAVGIPAAYVIGNNYDTVSEALLNGAPVPSKSEVGKGILDIAQSLMPNSSHKPLPATRGHKFLEFFHVAQSSEQPGVWHD